jgi:hypothetical protein
MTLGGRRGESDVGKRVSLDKDIYIYIYTRSDIKVMRLVPKKSFI